jgi:hypothetical protein
VDGFTKVIGYSKLRKNYHQYQEKRELCRSYAAFFADDRIVPMLPAVLGKVFFEKKKQPLPVNVAKVGAVWRCPHSPVHLVAVACVVAASSSARRHRPHRSSAVDAQTDLVAALEKARDSTAFFMPYGSCT